MIKKLLSKIWEFLCRPVIDETYHCGCCYECDLETDCVCEDCEWIDLTDNIEERE
jgi:hypothetical protein